MLRGKTLGLNRTMDAGLMKITEGSDYPFVEMGISDGLKEGQWCLATGHPGGYQSDRSPVLRLGRILLSDRTAITTDCTLVGGDSGGPLFDMQGRVIGINSRISGPLTANMHVPVNTFKDTWARLEKGDAWGHFPGHEPYIGIRGEAETDVAKIAHIFEDSPAETAGLKVGDVVLSLNDDAVNDFASLTAMVREMQPGDNVRLKIKRGDETKEIQLTIGKRGG
jgi:serine protease Do